ncbi:MAG: cytochrome c-type biogenesis protein CcmH [Acidimicrobiia bacterium]|nr:cytochrome c-type biogenesis protein CcmH [Acidimicrobiia bacterium]
MPETVADGRDGGSADSDGDGAGLPPRRNRTVFWVSVAVGVVVLLLVGVLATRETGDTTETSPLLGELVPPVAGETIDGASYDIDEHRGEWVVVNFFATWCPRVCPRAPRARGLLRGARGRRGRVGRQRDLRRHPRGRRRVLRRARRRLAGDHRRHRTDRRRLRRDRCSRVVPGRTRRHRRGQVDQRRSRRRHRRDDRRAPTGRVAVNRRKSPTGVWVAWGLMAVVLVVALVVGATGSGTPRTDQERVYDIADTINCPQCVGQSVADSNVQIAREIRAEIAREVDAGNRTDAQIVDGIIASFGEDVSQNPRSTGVAGLVWVLPVLAVVAAVAGLVAVFRRWGRDEPSRATDADRRLVEAALCERDDGTDGPAAREDGR